MWIGREVKVNPKHEQVKNIVIGKTSTWELVTQSSDLLKEAVRLELTSHQWKTGGMGVVCYNVSSKVRPDRED